MNTYQETRIVIVDDRLWKSIVRDAVTLAVGLVLMGVGSMMNNGAMEVAGFIVWARYLLSKARRASPCKTLTEARDRLDALDTAGTTQ